MKRGAKRTALFGSAPDATDSDLRSKRVMEAPSFDVHRAESSHQHLMAGPPLDVKRAESSRQHVRALNTQFASWVQLQLQNHPDELWEDGVRDYLSYASQIMEKFKDVVDWLRANAAKTGSISSSSFPANKHNLGELSEKAKPRLFPEISNGFAREDTPATISGLQSSGLSSSQSSGFLTSIQVPVFPGSQTPVFSGNQSSTPPKTEASADADEENESEQPSSPSLKKTEEKGVIVVHEAKCKVYVKPDSPAEKGWKDIGMGQLSIKCKEGANKATKESKPTIVIRNDVGKILLNALLYPGIKMNIQKNTIASIFHTSGGEHTDGVEAGKNEIAVARMYLLRLKSEDETVKLATSIKEYAPLA